MGSWAAKALREIPHILFAVFVTIGGAYMMFRVASLFQDFWDWWIYG